MDKPIHLYNLTLAPASTITHSINGSFTAPGVHQLVVVRGSSLLQLYHVDDDYLTLQCIYKVQGFGNVRSLAPFRLLGSARDHIVVGSDSGKIVVLEATDTSFVVVHSEAYGRSGDRRAIAGQYLCSDPRGRAVMIAAAQKHKLVYVFNRDAQARLTISSPLDASRTSAITWCLRAMDNGYENPLFAAIEVDDEETRWMPDGPAWTPSLVVYELDLGLNVVVRKWALPIGQDSNDLVAVPGGENGPGGVLVCGDGQLTYVAGERAKPVVAAFPRREGMIESRGTTIVAHATHSQRSMFFFLLLSQYGDLFKVSLVDGNSRLQITYFDTIDSALSINIMKNGFLFAAKQGGGAYSVYQFLSLGEDAAQESTFQVRDELKHLSLVDGSIGPSPCASALVVAPQAYLTGEKSLHVIKHGLRVQMIAQQSLPGSPSSVWCCPRKRGEPDSLISLSFADATLTLLVSEDSVSEVSEEDSGFLAKVSSVHVALLGEDSLVQCHSNGVRHVRSNGRVVEWKPPPGIRLVAATSCNTQLAIALTGGKVIYFELDNGGQLLEHESYTGASTIVDISMPPPAEGHERAPYIAVADIDSCVRILSLAPRTMLQQVSLQSLSGQPHSLALSYLARAGSSQTQLFLHVGLENGVMLRSSVDSVTGQLSDTRSRYLGNRAVRCISAHDGSILALSSRAWLTYNEGGGLNTLPLHFGQPMQWAWPFGSAAEPNGIVGLAGSSLIIFKPTGLDAPFHSDQIPMAFTPRRVVQHEPSGLLVVGEATKGVNSQGQYSTASDASSQIRLLNGQGETVAQHLIEGEFLTCLYSAPMASREGRHLIFVGTSVGSVPLEGRLGTGRLYAFEVREGNQLVMLHRTELERPPGAMTALDGRLLVGIGKCIRLMDCGQKKMLRKCENKGMYRAVVSLQSWGNRIYIGDVQEGFIFAYYDPRLNVFRLFADETQPRWTTAMTLLDFDTVVGADKFGNVWISRLPGAVNEQLIVDPGDASRWQEGRIGGAPFKLDQINQFHVGETVTSLHRTTLLPGGTEVIIYVTVFGTIGALLPFVSAEDVDFFQKLETELQMHAPPVFGNRHERYRSRYFPVRHVVDGDLCNVFSMLPATTQRKIAAELDRSPIDILRKLEDIKKLAV